MAGKESSSLVEFAESLQAKGRYTFTRSEAVKSSGRSRLGVEAALRRLKRRRRIATPRRGFHVIVPLEYREAGCPPASWFIDDLMRFLDQPYYVALLSAAALHGAAHQQPMVFQVMTDRPTRQAVAGRVRVKFHMSRDVRRAPTVDMQTETGSLRVSTAETTAYDLVRHLPAAGYLGNVVTVLGDLAERIEPAALENLAKKRAAPEVQRLGYVLDRLGEGRSANAVFESLRKRRYRAVLLVPGRPRGRRAADSRWRVVPNEPLEERP